MPGSTNPLVAYGLLGLILAIFGYLILTEQLVAGRSHKREISRADAAEIRAAAAETSKSAMEELFRKEVIPTMTRFLDLAGELSSQAQATRRRS